MAYLTTTSISLPFPEQFIEWKFLQTSDKTVLSSQEEILTLRSNYLTCFYSNAVMLGFQVEFLYNHLNANCILSSKVLSK